MVDLPPVYTDEDASHHDWVSALRNAGFDMMTANEAGMRGRSDRVQLEFASDSGRAILTHNVRDFRLLHYEWSEAGRSHAGILLVQQGDRLGPGEVARRLLALAARCGPDGLANRAEFLD